MEFRKEGDKVIIRYEEDGSEWLFLGFFRQVGRYYMILTELGNVNLPFEAMPKIRVHLPRNEYVLVKTEIVELTGYPKHSKFKRRKEMPLDYFVDGKNPKANTKTTGNKGREKKDD